MASHTDGASVPQGKRNGITNKLQASHASYLQGVHCVVLQSNLIMQCLSNLKTIHE